MLWGGVFNVLLHVCVPSQLMSGALHSQCFSSDVTVFNDANTTENNPDLGEYHACSADKGDADCPGPPGAYICRFGWVDGTPKAISLLLGSVLPSPASREEL